MRRRDSTGGADDRVNVKGGLGSPETRRSTTPPKDLHGTRASLNAQATLTSFFALRLARTALTRRKGAAKGHSRCAARVVHTGACAPATSGRELRCRFGRRRPNRRAGLGARGLQRVAQQHGDGHRADSARDRGDQPRALARALELDVADQPVVGAVDADVDDGRALLDPVAAGSSRGRPTAAISTSARRQTPGRSRVREWHTVTVAFCSSRSWHERLADQVRAAHHDRLRALERRRRGDAAAPSRPTACTAAARAGPWSAARPTPA